MEWLLSPKMQNFRKSMKVMIKTAWITSKITNQWVSAKLDQITTRTEKARMRQAKLWSERKDTVAFCTQLYQKITLQKEEPPPHTHTQINIWFFAHSQNSRVANYSLIVVKYKTFLTFGFTYLDKVQSKLFISTMKLDTCFKWIHCSGLSRHQLTPNKEDFLYMICILEGTPRQTWMK